MKIQFYCYNCNEKFNIADKYLVGKDSVTCPNCSLKFNEESFLHLKHAMQNIIDANKANSSEPRLDFNFIDPIQ